MSRLRSILFAITLPCAFCYPQDGRVGPCIVKDAAGQDTITFGLPDVVAKKLPYTPYDFIPAGEIGRPIFAIVAAHLAAVHEKKLLENGYFAELAKRNKTDIRLQILAKLVDCMQPSADKRITPNDLQQWVNDIKAQIPIHAPEDPQTQVQTPLNHEATSTLRDLNQLLTQAEPSFDSVLQTLGTDRTKLPDRNTKYNSSFRLEYIKDKLSDTWKTFWYGKKEDKDEKFGIFGVISRGITLACCTALLLSIRKMLSRTFPKHYELITKGVSAVVYTSVGQAKKSVDCFSELLVDLFKRFV